MKDQLHQGGSLDVPALDVVYAVYVEKMILVIVGEQTFHLGWVHPAVRLADVDDRQIQGRKDIDRHPFDRELNPPCFQPIINFLGANDAESDEYQGYQCNEYGFGPF